MMNRNGTIAAIATAPGRAGIGIVRISGSDLTQLASQARQVQNDLAGGASTIVISTTTIILVLLIVILIVVAS